PAENIAPEPGADTVHELRKTCLGTIHFLAEIRLPGRHRALRFHRQPDEIESATGVEAGAGCGEPFAVKPGDPVRFARGAGQADGKPGHDTIYAKQLELQAESAG